MLEYQIGQGYSALDAQAWRDRLDGYAVKSGLAVSWDSGLTFTVGSGEATMGETSGVVESVSLDSSASVTLDSPDSTNPRKDTIYLDSAGAVGVEVGAPREERPMDASRFDTYQPGPPEPSAEGVVLAEVWVPPNTSSLASEDVRDRRVPAEAVSDTAVVRALAGLSGTPLEDVEGDNLSVDSEGGLNASGGGYDTVNSVSADATASDGDLVFADASSANVAVTLPAPEEGGVVGVERTDASSNSVSVEPNASESVNYEDSEELVAQGESLDFVSDGTDWYVI